MARVVIVGCGCRGRALARELCLQGHAVRGTTRLEAGRAAIEAAGAEPWVGDPDRLATITGALERATVLCWLLGSAVGPGPQVAALHGDRLRSLLSWAIDTPVRGVVYEAAGTVDAALLLEGVATVRAVCANSRIPYALLAEPPGPLAPWLRGAVQAVEAVLR
jgi:nucleoside-diphosphate-sugar epimerase